MGRIKDFLMEAQEMKEEGIDWVTVKQNEIVNVHSGKTSLIYNDLFDMDDLEGDGYIWITTVEGKTYKMPKSSITYVNGNCIRYTSNVYSDDNGESNIIGKRLNSIPIDKITHMVIDQLYGNEEE